MNFNFSRCNLSPGDKLLERFLEVLPGFLSWFILLAMIVLSIWKPYIAAAVIIAFNLYWLIRVFYMIIFLVFSYIKLSFERKVDWMERIGRTELLKLENIHHLVIIPIVTESRQIIESSVASIAISRFPVGQIILVLAVEARAAEDVKSGARSVQEKFKGSFFDLLLVEHPIDLPGEARVKGANATYAAKESAKYLTAKQIPFENVVVSCFDADTVVSKDYFPCLTYNFIVCPQRTRASFQPIPVYHNNIWEVPAFARVLDVGSSFFQLIEATNPVNLVTFSSHSMSFRALVEIGYWPVDLISDDSAIYWKAFIYYGGDYRVVPLYVTVSMDIAAAESWHKTFINVYKQKRRWAWGVENFPIVMRGFLSGKDIPFWKKAKHAFKLLEGNISWATWPFLLGVISWLPAIFAGREFSNSVLFYSTPRLKAIIFNLACLGLLTTSFLSVCLLPKKNLKVTVFKRISHFFEWLLVPVISIFLSAIPALDAQTRLMFGKYMEFWVTEKSRKIEK